MTPEIIPRTRTHMTGFVTDCTIRRFTLFRTEFSRERISLRKERKRRGTWHFSFSLCKQSQRTMNHTAREPRIPGGDDKVLDYRAKKNLCFAGDENGLKCPARTKLTAFVINEWNDEIRVSKGLKFSSQYKITHVWTSYTGRYCMLLIVLIIVPWMEGPGFDPKPRLKHVREIGSRSDNSII